MKWFYDVRKSLLGRLILSILIIWIPFTAFVLGGLVIVSRHLTKETINNQTDKVKYYSAIINADIERVMQSMYQLCGNKAIVEFTGNWKGQVDYPSFLAYLEAYNTIKEYRNISMYIDDVFVYLPDSNEVLSANYSIIPADDIFQTMKKDYLENEVSFFHFDDALYYISQGSNSVMVGIKVSLLDIRYTLRGYESEENYLFLEENGQLAYIKPQNYEISKTRKYRQDIGRMENMKYDEKADCYYCKNGQVLTVQYEKREKTASGYRRTVTVYRSNGCSGCPFKTDCIKGNNCKIPMEDRQKVLYVSKKMKEKRQETLERITSDYGTQLRMNRSIQAEGSFANIKEDMEFRRYLYRGNANVTAQSILLAIGYNINKLHHKIQAGRTGRHLFPLKQTA